MRTSRCILYTALGTVLCLFYVFQQTEIVKLAYRITSTEKILESALDKKTSFEYTLSSLESPLSLDKNLFLKNNGFEMAGKYKLVKVDNVNTSAKGSPVKVAAVKTSNRGVLFKRLAFSAIFASKQAEAKTVK
ncbi:MAG: hypothetical protein V1840_05725 [Candidatus Omnitrophota bacterium]